jgi:hypothetical protein
MFTAMARSLRSTPESIAIPCSVKTRGRLRRPPCPPLDITNCDFKRLNSSVDSRNMKSAGKRFRCVEPAARAREFQRRKDLPDLRRAFTWRPRTTRIRFSIAGAASICSDSFSPAGSAMSKGCQTGRMFLSTSRRQDQLGSGKGLGRHPYHPHIPNYNRLSIGATKMTESPLKRKVWSALEPPMLWA